MKMAARLQQATAGNAPILLRVRTGTGHGHSKPRKMIINEIVEENSMLNLALG